MTKLSRPNLMRIAYFRNDSYFGKVKKTLPILQTGAEDLKWVFINGCNNSSYDEADGTDTCTVYLGPSPNFHITPSKYVLLNVQDVFKFQNDKNCIL